MNGLPIVPRTPNNTVPTLVGSSKKACPRLLRVTSRSTFDPITRRLVEGLAYQSPDNRRRIRSAARKESRILWRSCGGVPRRKQLP